MPPYRAYTLTRFPEGSLHVTFREAAPPYQVRELTPARSLKVWNHSPSGFNCGYFGSGPAQLALAMLLNELDDEHLASSLHQELKRRVIAQVQVKPQVVTLIGADVLARFMEEFSYPCATRACDGRTAHPDGTCSRCDEAELARYLDGPGR